MLFTTAKRESKKMNKPKHSKQAQDFKVTMEISISSPISERELLNYILTTLNCTEHYDPETHKNVSVSVDLINVEGK
jgi:hypothetical protein